MKTHSKLIVYGDGGSRGNPGNAAYGFAILDEENHPVYSEGKRIGINTNNVAEYSAVINALRWILQNAPETKTIAFFLDSMLIASQMSGTYRVKHPNMKELFITAKQLEGQLKANISYTQIPRAKNKIADKLVNDALDGLI